MTDAFQQSETFQRFVNDIEASNGLLQEAWVPYKGEKWYPVMMTERSSCERNFVLNSTNEWGSKQKVLRDRLTPFEFLDALNADEFPLGATIRCKRLGDTERNGRKLSDLQVSSRLSGLIEQLKKDKASTKLDATLSGPATGSVEVSDFVEQDEFGDGYEPNPFKWRLIEKHAITVARNFYKALDYKVKELGKPFDLLCEKATDSIHVEVKGSQTALMRIIVTKNEVKDALDENWRSDLFLVDCINLEGKSEETWVTSGGRIRHIQNWQPEAQHLEAIQFRYTLQNIDIID